MGTTGAAFGLRTRFRAGLGLVVPLTPATRSITLSSDIGPILRCATAAGVNQTRPLSFPHSPKHSGRRVNRIPEGELSTRTAMIWDAARGVFEPDPRGGSLDSGGD